MNETIRFNDEDFNFYLFLDIDDVLNPRTAFYSQSKAWPDYKWVNQYAQSQITSPMMVEGLNDFIRTYAPTVFMVTSWEEQAKAFCQLIGLEGSADWLWLNATDDRGGVWSKFGSVREIATTEERVAPAIWIDDDIVNEHEAAFWAAENDVLTLTPTSNHGITPAHLEQMRNYAERIIKERRDSEDLEETIQSNFIKNTENSNSRSNVVGRIYNSSLDITNRTAKSNSIRYF